MSRRLTDTQLQYELAEQLVNHPDHLQLCEEVGADPEDAALDAAAGMMGCGREYALEQLRELSARAGQ